MAWAKTPVVASVAVCAACLAAAATLPAPAFLTKTVEAGVNLSAVNYIDFANQSAFDGLGLYAIINDPASTPAQIAAAQQKLALISAIPSLTLLQANDRSGFYGLSSTNALQSFDIYQNGNGLDPDDDGYIPPGSFNAFVPTASNGGFAALSGVSSLQAYQYSNGNPAALAGIDAFSAIPAIQRLQANDRTALYDLDSTNATNAFDRFNDGHLVPDYPGDPVYGPGSFQAFVPVDDDPDTPDVDESYTGYQALSGIKSLQDYQASNGDLSKLNGIDAFSAIKSLPEPPATPLVAPVTSVTPPVTNAKVQSRLAPIVQDTSAPAEESTGPDVSTQEVSAPVVNNAPAPAPAPAPSGKKPGNGSYSGSFSPVGAPVLFGSGGGKSAADNGMRGYGDVANGLRKALGMGPDKSAGGGDTGTGGDAG